MIITKWPMILLVKCNKKKINKSYIYTIQAHTMLFNESCLQNIVYSHIEKNRSHHPVGQRSVFKLSAVLPTITYGGSTRVLINIINPTTAIISPSLFNRSLSVIFTTLADLTLNITDILRTRLSSNNKLYQKSLKPTYHYNNLYKSKFTYIFKNIV